MTYSWVAAIHLIVLFATDNILDLQKIKSHCEKLPIPGSNEPFLACAGVSDPDICLSPNIVNCVMLGALPMAALSSTFKKSTGKAILIFWLLLLAISHIFDNLVLADPNTHFQLCPEANIEPTPGDDFQAPFLEQSWYDSYHSLVSTTQQVSEPIGNHSYPSCIYSCFATTAYVRRRRQDITVDLNRPEAWVNSVFIRNLARNKRSGIIFWWLYTLLAFSTILTAQKPDWLPQWIHTQVSLPKC